MSSNQYGFECSFAWKGRIYEAQIVYVGTSEDDPGSDDAVQADWESSDPRDLARYELDHRDWGNIWGARRIEVWSTWGGWLEDDPEDPSWSPPKPPEREVLEIIARGEATDIVHGWDT